MDCFAALAMTARIKAIVIASEAKQSMSAPLIRADESTSGRPKA
jgi:hypothetical protein